MMINGYDLTIPCSLDEQQQYNLFSFRLGLIWEEMVIEYEYVNHLDVFVYQNKQWRDDWDLNGRTEENKDKMINFMSDKECFHLVYEANLDFDFLKGF